MKALLKSCNDKVKWWPNPWEEFFQHPAGGQYETRNKFFTFFSPGILCKGFVLMNTRSHLWWVNAALYSPLAEAPGQHTLALAACPHSRALHGASHGVGRRQVSRLPGSFARQSKPVVSHLPNSSLPLFCPVQALSPLSRYPPHLLPCVWLALTFGKKVNKR